MSGDPTKATAALGKVFVQIKIDNAVTQIQGLMAAAPSPRAGRAAAVVAAAVAADRSRRPRRWASAADDGNGAGRQPTDTRRTRSSSTS